MVVHTRPAERQQRTRERIAVDGLVCQIDVAAPPMDTAAARRRAARFSRRWASGVVRADPDSPAVALVVEEADPPDCAVSSSDTQEETWPLGWYILLFLWDVENDRFRR